MSTALRTMTADELLHMPEDGYRYELLEGELHRFNLHTAQHGCLVASMTSALGRFVKQESLGSVVSATGFLFGRNPDTVRAPDIAFVSKEQLDRCVLSVTVYRSLHDIHVLTAGDQLTGNSLLPGFEYAVADLFSGIK